MFPEVPELLELLVTRAYSYGYSLMHKPQRLFCLQMQVLGFSKRICRCVHTCVERFITMRLAQVIIKAEKSHELQSASWRPRKANGVNPSPRAGEAQTGWQEGSCPPSAFVLCKFSVESMMPIHTGEDILVYLNHQFRF